MLLGELQTMASSLGISGTARMRKSDLVAAIEENQADGRVPRARAEASARAQVAARGEAPRTEVRAEVRDGEVRHAEVRDEVRDMDTDVATETRAPRRAARAAGPPEPRDDRGTDRAGNRAGDRNGVDHGPAERFRADAGPASTPDSSLDRGVERAGRVDRDERAERPTRADRDQRGERGDRTHSDRGQGERSQNERSQGERSQNERNHGERGQTERPAHGDADDDDGGNRRGRRSRFRDRRRGRGERGAEGGAEPQVTDDDVLVQVAGIIDVLDNYAFVRTSGYLPGSNDVYVSMSQIKKYGLRRGDAVTGAVRTAREGEQRRDKYNPLVRLDTINGMDPEEARRRPEFYKLTPLYPQERLRLETEPHILTTRVIDLVMPMGKGQRALIVSPPKAGKTMVLQAVANAIATNNPECHLMVVLVDERPEEVTDMQRSVKGEVIASTFDRPPQDHTTVAELAIERAKRLVELGHDVVVLLDSITRLGRAYNLAAPASGRILSGGIDSTALYPPKRFLGAARNIENGGSLTILATALVETGSMMDTVIFEEFKGTGNAELKLDRKIADKRVFPAIDVDPSSTRKEEILLAPDELAIVHKLRKVLHSLESQAALDLLLSKLKETRTNIEFLMQIAKTTPGD
jgi:transcription termination factor Rho